MIIIKDDYERDYEVQDIEAFKSHIAKYHSKNGRGDGSLHEENGYWLKVTDSFYQQIMSL